MRHNWVGYYPLQEQPKAILWHKLSCRPPLLHPRGVEMGETLRSSKSMSGKGSFFLHDDTNDLLVPQKQTNSVV